MIISAFRPRSQNRKVITFAIQNWLQYSTLLDGLVIQFTWDNNKKCFLDVKIV